MKLMNRALYVFFIGNLLCGSTIDAAQTVRKKVTIIKQSPKNSTKIEQANGEVDINIEQAVVEMVLDQGPQASLIARVIAVTMGALYGASQQLVTNFLIDMSIPDGDPNNIDAATAQRKLKENFATGMALLSLKQSGSFNDLPVVQSLRTYEAELLKKYTTADVDSLRKPHKVGHEIGVAAANFAYIWLKRFKATSA